MRGFRETVTLMLVTRSYLGLRSSTKLKTVLAIHRGLEFCRMNILRSMELGSRQLVMRMQRGRV